MKNADIKAEINIGAAAAANLAGDRALILRASGAVVPMEHKWKRPTLEELQAAVGGFIEMVPMPAELQHMVLICDEEGLIKQKPLNQAASLMAGQRVVGDCVYMPRSMMR